MSPAPASHRIAVSAVRDETPIDRTLTLPIPPGAESEFRFVPGQFVTVSDPEDAVQPPRRRAYSISSSPTDFAGPGERPAVEISVRDMGDFGSRLYRFPAGRALDVIAPRGKFTLDAASADDLALFAGGSGVTPFRSYVRFLSATGATRTTTLVYSGQTPEQLLFDGEFRTLAARHPWFHYIPTVTRLPEGARFAGRRGRIDLDLVRSIVKSPARTLVYACGPGAFVDASLALALEAGVPKERTKREVWG